MLLPTNCQLILTIPDVLNWHLHGRFTHSQLKIACVLVRQLIGLLGEDTPLPAKYSNSAPVGNFLSTNVANSKEPSHITTITESSSF